MYVNKPVVLLTTSTKRTNSRLKLTSNNKTRKQKTPNVMSAPQSEQLVGKQLEILEILFQLERRVEMFAANISHDLIQLQKVSIGQTLQNEITNKQRLMEITSQSLIQRQIMNFKHNKSIKNLIQASIQQIKIQQINQSKKFVENLKQNISKDQVFLKQIAQKQQQLTLLKQQLDIQMKNKIKKSSAYRESQFKCKTKKQELFERDRMIFQQQVLEENKRQQLENYKQNVSNIEKMQVLQTYKSQLLIEIEQSKRLYESLMKKRIQSIILIRGNVDKINKSIEEYKKIQVTQQQSFQPRKNKQNPSFKQYKQSLLRQYTDSFLQTPISVDHNDCKRYKTNLSNDESKSFEIQDDRIFNLSRKRTYDEISYKNKHQHMSPYSLVNYERSRPQKLKAVQGSILIKRNNRHLSHSIQDYHIKKQANSIQMNKNKIQLEQLYCINADKVKGKLIDQLIPKAYRQQIPGQKTQHLLTFLNNQNDHLELISVSEGENNQNFDYISVEINKNDIKRLQ